MKHIIEDFSPLGGRHCITAALHQIFCWHNCPLSEDMIFGIASGLAFTYLNMSDAPMVSGRTKPFLFENKLADRLHIQIKCRQPKSYDSAFEQAKKMIDKNLPVLVYVDMPYLNYLSLDKNSHFGGHAVVLFGYDDEAKVFYVSDRDHSDYPIRTPVGNIAKDYHLVSYEELKKARSSHFRPFPANYKYLEFDFDGLKKIEEPDVYCAIQDTCISMLNPPAQLLGINGILKFSKEILKWRKFEDYKLRNAGITNYFQIHEDGGTGGGIFRKMYGQFLVEADTFLNNKELYAIGKSYIALSDEWDLIARFLWQLSETGNPELLYTMSKLIYHLYEKEKALLLHMQASIVLP